MSSDDVLIRTGQPSRSMLRWYPARWQARYGDERSGGPVQVVGHESIFRVNDVARAVAHYQRLGFRTDLHDETYAFAHFGNLTLHLAQDGGEGWPGYQPEHHMTSVLYIHVEDADRLAASWREAYRSRDHSTRTTARVKASTSIPTATSFDSDHRFHIESRGHG